MTRATGVRVVRIALDEPLRLDRGERRHQRLRRHHQGPRARCGPRLQRRHRGVRLLEKVAAGRARPGQGDPLAVNASSIAGMLLDDRDPGRGQAGGRGARGRWSTATAWTDLPHELSSTTLTRRPRAGLRLGQLGSHSKPEPWHSAAAGGPVDAAEQPDRAVAAGGAADVVLLHQLLEGGRRRGRPSAGSRPTRRSMSVGVATHQLLELGEVRVEEACAWQAPEVGVLARTCRSPAGGRRGRRGARPGCRPARPRRAGRRRCCARRTPAGRWRCRPAAADQAEHGRHGGGGDHRAHRPASATGPPGEQRSTERG